MPRGVILRWHEDKGFGFIRPNEGGENVFCHVTSLLDGDGSVRDGDEVIYEVEWDDRKGKERAREVEAVGGGRRKRRGSRSRSRSPRSRSRRRSPPPRRGGGGGGGGGGEQERRPGDWDCPNCGAMVFGSKDRCFKCGEPRPSMKRNDSRDRRGRSNSR
ncbi:CSP3 [Symbiodinium pilosum]|uniref:CSP3 protein n=1 Tax=Symbiodinium pilosum TaxID=2952 RepID=A0A812T0N0_SYMPI|nr:CSP3 [Symbiodinium pilosum]